MTMFGQGDRVRSRVTAQGLVQDDLYVITSVACRPTPFGDVVTYFVSPIDSATSAAKQETLAIGNGQFVLEAV